eukprot:COSAG02_NODE_6024_length_3868_cov_2.355001_2_plen_1105_part_00
MPLEQDRLRQPENTGVVQQADCRLEFRVSQHPGMRHGWYKNVAAAFIFILSILHVHEAEESDLDAAACGKLASETLQMSVCHQATTTVCTPECASLWLSASARCRGDHLELAFNAAVPASMAAACYAAAAFTAAAAPAISVAGLTCGQCERHNAMSYALQPVALNGRPHYATVDGDLHVYWTPSFWNAAGWVIDTDTDNVEVCAMIVSGAENPPGGSNVWVVSCRATSVHLRLDITPSHLTEKECIAAARQLVPKLAVTCCGTGNYMCPLQNGEPPSTCSVDCAHLWQSYTSVCPNDVAINPASWTSFVQTHCSTPQIQLLVLQETVSMENFQVRDFAFEARPGVRYDVEIRAAAGNLERSTACSQNLYDTCNNCALGHMSCDDLLSQYSCASDFCTKCKHAHFCDRSCNIRCPEVGVSDVSLFVVPPGTTDAKYSVITMELATGGDIGAAFTATAPGRYMIKVEAFTDSDGEIANGFGNVTVAATALGTSLERSPTLLADGNPHIVDVTCSYDLCTFLLDGVPALDGDGTGFDLALPNAETGRAYGVLIELPNDQAAAQVTATFYQANAVEGSAGFQNVANGPMGNWTLTPAGHESWFEHYGCSNTDRAECYTVANLRASFGVHPGGQFAMYRAGTWVAPTSGPVLLRLLLNCDVPFYADVQADGCTFHPNGGYRCNSTVSYTCGSKVRLTVTPGAYFPDIDAIATSSLEPARRMQSGGDHLSDSSESHAAVPLLIHGISHRVDTITVARTDVEAQAAAVWEQTSVDKRLLTAPPSLDAMLMSNTAANAMLVSLFSVKQQPHVVYPVDLRAAGTNDVCHGSTNRRLQQRGDELHLTIETHAPSATLAADAETKTIKRLPGAQVCSRRRAQSPKSSTEGALTGSGVCGLGSVDPGCTVRGQSTRRIKLSIPRGAAERMVCELAAAGTSPSSNALSLAQDDCSDFTKDMLVSATPANTLLASALVESQEPVAMAPISFKTARQSRRHLQAGGDLLHITVETHGATDVGAATAVRRLVSRVNGSSVRVVAAPSHVGTCDLPARSNALNDECCDEPAEDCSTGVPTICNIGCAMVVLPFFEDCSEALGPQASQFESVLALCRAAIGN